MSNYRVVTEHFNIIEFSNFKEASEATIKNKGMLYVNRNGEWVKHRNWSELIVPNRVEKNGYTYSERAEAKIFKCLRCGKINIVVNNKIMYCKDCKGSIKELK